MIKSYIDLDTPKVNITFQNSRGGDAVRRSPRVWKNGCSIPSRDRPKSLKQVVAPALLNAWL